MEKNKENNVCGGSPCGGGNKKCDFCHGIVHLMAEHDKEANARVAKYEELLRKTEEVAAAQIARSEQRIDKMMEIVAKMEDYMDRMEKMHNDIKKDEDNYVKRLIADKETLMAQNTTLTNLVGAVCMPANHHGTHVNINK